MAISGRSPAYTTSQLMQLSESLAEFFSGPGERADSLPDMLLPFFSSLGWDRVSSVDIPRCIRVESGWSFCLVEKDAPFPPLPPRFRQALIAVCAPGKETGEITLEKDTILQGAWNLNHPVCIFLTPGRFVLYDTSVMRLGRKTMSRAIETWSPADPDENALKFRNSISPVPLMWRISRHNRTLPPEPDETAFTLQDALARRVRYWKERAERQLRATDPGLHREERNVRAIQIVFQLILAIINRELHEPRSSYPPGVEQIPGIPFSPCPGLDDENLRRLCAYAFPGPDLFLCVVPPEIYSRTFFAVLNEKERRQLKRRKRPFHEPGPLQSPPDVVPGLAAGMLVWALTRVFRGKDPVRILDPYCRTGRFLLELAAMLSTAMLTCTMGEEDAGQEQTPLRRITLPEIRLFGVDPDPVMLECTKFVFFLRDNVIIRSAPGKETNPLLGYPPGSELPGVSFIRGDAIIGPDILTDLFRAETGSGREPVLFPIDWTVNFPWVNESGFDGIGGEFLFPPDTLPRTIKDYLARRYRSYRPEAGLEDCYIERSIGSLKVGGSYSAILPGNWLSAAPDMDARQMISEKEILAILEYGPERPGTAAHRGDGYCIVVGKNAPPEEMTEVMHTSIGRVPGPLITRRRKIPVPSGRDGWSLKDPRLGEIRALIMTHGIPLTRYLLGEIYQGTLPVGFRPEPPQHLTGTELPAGFLPYLLGSSVSPYVRAVPDGYLPVYEPGTRSSPARADHEKPGISHGISAHESRPADDLIIAMGPQSLRATLGPRQMRYDQGILFAPHPDLYLVGVINSSVTRFYMEFNREGAFERPGETIVSRTLGFPVHVIDTASAEESRIRERIQLLVERMFLLGSVSKGPLHGSSDKLVIRVRHTSRAIDSLVCRLYGITPSGQELMDGYLDNAVRARMAGDHHNASI
jgi:hypothetical protein